MTLRWHRMSREQRRGVRTDAKFQADRRRGRAFAAEDMCPKCHRLICMCDYYNAQMVAIHDECRKMGLKKPSWWMRLRF